MHILHFYLVLQKIDSDEGRRQSKMDQSIKENESEMKSNQRISTIAVTMVTKIILNHTKSQKAVFMFRLSENVHASVLKYYHIVLSLSNTLFYCFIIGLRLCTFENHIVYSFCLKCYKQNSINSLAMSYTMKQWLAGPRILMTPSISIMYVVRQWQMMWPDPSDNQIEPSVNLS